jgi:transcriptional regulator with XRE-family HTH domain
MKHDANLIGRKIARLRYQKGWTQNTLVAKLQVLGSNITRDMLANIELRRCVATDKHCGVLAQVFSVDINELFQP